MRVDILLGLVAYLGLMLWIGQKAGAKIASTKDYVLAGRNIPFWLNTTSLFATWFGAETCMGAAGASYEEGLLGVLEDPLGAALCLFILGLFIAGPMVKMNVLTLSDFMRERFGKGIGIFSAICFICSYLSWLGSQLVAFGFILSSITGFPTLWGTMLGSAVVLIYTYRGGLLADILTDFIQAVVLIPGIFILFIVVVHKLGGWQGFTSAIPSENWHVLPRESGVKAWVWYIQAWAVIGLGSLPSQDLYQRVCAGKNLFSVRTACFLAGFLYLTVGMMPVLLGMAGKKLFPAMDHPEHILLTLAREYLHPLGLVVFLGALLSAIMSTADSIILAPATLFTQNILKPFLKDQSDANILRWCRRSTIGVTAIALMIALSFKKIYALTMNSSALLMATLLVPFIAGLFWPKANPAGAIAAVVTGTLALLVGQWVWPNYPLAFLAAGCSLAALVLTVFLTHRKNFLTGF